MKKGFTLVELLVVVAILGVLAAVGIVSFGGFLTNSKENTARSNHKQICTWMQTEITKCQLGESQIKLIPQDQSCNSLTTSAKFEGWFANHLDSEWKNPYDPSAKSADSRDECSDNLGQINLQNSDDDMCVKIQTKVKKDSPCLVCNVCRD